MCLIVPFSNGRREGANPSSRVIVLPNQEFLNHFVDQLCCLKLGISVPSLRTCIPGDRSHSYRKDRSRLHLIFVVFQVERETVMTYINTYNNIYIHILYTYIYRRPILSELLFVFLIFYWTLGPFMSRFEFGS